MHPASDELIDDILRTVDDQNHWSIVLQQLVDKLGARSARLLELNTQADAIKNSIIINHDSNYLKQYADHFVNTCPWRPELTQLPKGQVYSSYLDFSCKQKAFYQTEFYNDWAKPQDIAHGLLGTIFEDDQSAVQLMFQRTHDHEHFSADDKAEVNRLVPYIRRAVELKRQFEKYEHKIATLESAQATHPAQPFMLFTEQGQVHYCSPEAERLLMQMPDAVRVSANRLRFQEDKYQHQWNQFFRRTGSKATLGVIRCHIDEGTELQIKITHLPESLDSLGFLSASQPLVIAYFFCIHEIRLDAEFLKQLYELTATEIRTVQAMANGLGAREISERFSTSENTVRTHIKRILKKTGMHSQGQLISSILKGPARINERF